MSYNVTAEAHYYDVKTLAPLIHLKYVTIYITFKPIVFHANSHSVKRRQENTAPGAHMLGGGSFVDASFSFPPPPAPPPPHSPELLRARFSVHRLGKELGPGMRRLWILPKLVIPCPLAEQEGKEHEREDNM